MSTAYFVIGKKLATLKLFANTSGKALTFGAWHNISLSCCIFHTI